MVDKWESRKYQSTWNMTWLVTALLVVPWIVNAVFGLALPVLIPAEVWSMLVAGLWGVYSAANVAEKHSSMMPEHVMFPVQESTDEDKNDPRTTVQVDIGIP